MKKISVILFSMLVMMASFFYQASGETPESVRFAMPSGVEPKFVQDYNYGIAFITRFVLQGNSIDDWTEAFEIVNAKKENYPDSPMEAYHKRVETRKKRCQEADFTIINQTPVSITYEVNSKKCPPLPDEQSINRVLYGKTNVFILIYTSRLPELMQKNHDSWLGTLSNAVILPAQ